MKKTILLIVAVLLIGYIIFDKIGDVGLTKEFTQKQDSLVQAVDSMKLTLAIDSAKIDSLIVVDNMLTFKVAYMKDHVKTVTKFIDSSIAKLTKVEFIVFKSKSVDNSVGGKRVVCSGLGLPFKPLSPRFR